ncbi:hypothetical protein K469DRAFT_54094 [Zopfia rhizophila CBS 207.26]|uniref:Uncharacterized protein n=1 Tax=Zopfia rhizophila CBS 207.26 TaxID=1314779 RepID=A0A6A6D8E8_9PEZI|nr:hypothetical protein K469DRAFT_54094 [Zopfia rhizophila CBS 207.26]
MSWYCCNCGHGPQNDAIDTGCPSCYHTWCKGCNKESMQYAADSDGKELQIECEDVSRDTATTAKNRLPSTTLAIGHRDNATALSPTFLISQGVKVVTPFPNSLPHYSIPLTQVELRCGNHTESHAYQFGAPVNRGQVYYVWYCCRCGDGPYNTSTNAGCACCTGGHWRCRDCTVEAVKC